MVIEMFYVIKRNDGHVFMQRHVPQDYTHADGVTRTTFEVLAHTDKSTATDLVLDTRVNF